MSKEKNKTVHPDDFFEVGMTGYLFISEDNPTGMGRTPEAFEDEKSAVKRAEKYATQHHCQVAVVQLKTVAIGEEPSNVTWTRDEEKTPATE